MSYLNTGLMIERRNVKFLIQVEGVPISLTRPAPMQTTAAGGVARSGQPTVLPPVKRWISTQGREQFEQGPVSAGPELKQYLLGTYDDDIRQGDYFTDPNSGRKFTIEYVHPDRTVETRAEIMEVE